MTSSQRLKRRSPKADTQRIPIHFGNDVFIDKPVSDVFGYVADFQNVPKWNDFVRTVEKETNGPVGVGTRYHQVRNHDQQRFIVTEFEPPRRIAIATVPQSTPAFSMALRIEPKGDGTILFGSWEFRAVRHRLLARLVGRRMAREAAMNLYRLKRLLENTAAPLQDCRTVRR